MAKREQQCIGYGIYERLCTNVAGRPGTPYWCERCDKLRRDHITRQLESICKSFDADPAASSGGGVEGEAR